MVDKNYRNLSIELLLEKLKNSSVSLNGYSFEEFSKNFDSPEEMMATLNSDIKELYPVVIELWRRLLPDRPSLSVFCNNLDYLIDAFEKGENHTEVYETLAELQFFLDENVDMGASPEEVFATIQNYVSNDLQDFLFTYILFEIEQGDLAYAADLLTGFYRYMEAKEWFQYLQARVLIEEDPVRGFEKLETLIDAIAKMGEEFELEIEILQFLALAKNHSLFTKLGIKMLEHLENEEDFLDVANICKMHFEELDLPMLTHQIDEMLQKRPFRKGDDPFSKSDPDKGVLERILNQKLQLL